jgi:hypothetical protein
VAEPKNKKPQPAGNYTVGYKKPPAEHQFKPSHPRDGAPKKTRGQRKEKAPDVAGMIEKSVQVKRGGKTINMHPFEAEVTSLGNRALKGEPRAAKLFLKHCEAAGLLEAPPPEQTHGVFAIPKGVNHGIVRVLLETCGLPPWDPDVYAALDAEYTRDQARIEELYIQFIKDLKNE